MNRILIIGATGNVGRQVVSQLPASGTYVRAMVRNPDAAGLPAHVELMRGDLTRPETLDECLDNIDTVFLVWFAPPTSAAAVLERIVRQARRIVFLSSPYKTAHPFFQKPQPNVASALHSGIERLIEASGREWTFLRPHMFATNALSWWAPQIRAGGDVIRWPYAAATTAPVHQGDIAAVAVRALCEDGHSGAEYLITGPEVMSQSEQISTIGDVIGRPLRMEDISEEEAREELLPVIPAYAIKYLLPAWSGAMEQRAVVTSTVAEVTGKPARTFRDWVTDHAAAFRLITADIARQMTSVR